MSRTAFLFPGQASQAVGMGVDFCRAFPRLRELFAMASERLGFDLQAVAASGPPRHLAETIVAQPAIFVLSFGIAELMLQRGIVPGVMAGHSLGEFTAVAVSGAVDVQAGIDLVVERASRMHEVNLGIDGAMLAVSGLTRAEVEAVCARIGDHLWVANVNAPSQVVVSGLRPALRRFLDEAGRAGAKGTWLDVAGPYHTPLMSRAAELLARKVRNMALGAPAVAVLANADARRLTTAEALREELAGHMLAPVDWPATLRAVEENAPGPMVEVGPGKVLKGLALRNDHPRPCLTTGTVAELDKTCRVLLEGA